MQFRGKGSRGEAAENAIDPVDSGFMTEAHYLADTFLHDPDIRTALAGDGGELRVAFDCEEFSTGLVSAMEIASVDTPVPGPYSTTELRFSQASTFAMI